jgi:hypothetical protein
MFCSGKLMQFDAPTTRFDKIGWPNRVTAIDPNQPFGVA